MRKRNISRITGIIAGCFLAVGTFTVNASAEDEAIYDASSEIVQTSLDEYGEIPVEGFSGENVTETEIATGMDEEGNIYILEEEGPTSLKQQGIELYASDPFFVNVRTKANTETTYYDEAETNIEGYICGKYGADAIYLGTEDGKIKFMLGGVVGLVDASEVELVSKSNAKSSNYYEVVNGKLIHRITTNIYASSYSSSLTNGPAPSYLKSGVKYYSYDGHYFYTNLDTMVSDYKAEHRNNSVNPATPFYNYYQFLPLRSYSSYSGSEMTSILNSRVSDSSLLKDLGDTFVEMQNKYGANALLTVGIAANESGWGTSSICKSRNNLFGINAVDATPGQSAYYYPNAETCVKDYTETFMSKQYFNPNNWKYRGAFLGDKASGMNHMYASDPYWGEKAAAIAWLLDGYGGNEDQFLYTIGIKDTICTEHTNLNIRQEPSTSTPMVYKTKPQSNHAFLILDTASNNAFYKIQSEPVLTEDRSEIAAGTGLYNKAEMYLYASTDYITIVSKGKEKLDDNIQGVFSDVSDISWYYDAVNYVYTKGIMTGMNETQFGPAVSVARAQFAVILHRMEGEPETTFKSVFKDVGNNLWYTNAIMWASDNGIVNGYENGKFGVSDYISREQMAVMMYRYAKYEGFNTNVSVSIDDYPDSGQVSSYAKEAMTWAVGTGIITGKDDGARLDPQGNANRAECATIIMRFLEYYR